jgi:hypothetical protein
MNIPEEGISYISAAILLNQPVKEAIATINKLVSDGILRYSRHEKGYAVWVKESTEPLEPREDSVKCVGCGQFFPMPKMGNGMKKYCSGDCKDKERAKICKTVKCAGCGKQFKAKKYKGKWTRYCDAACYSRTRKKS